MKYKEKTERLKTANNLMILELQADVKERDATIAKLRERLNHERGEPNKIRG